MKYCFPDSLLLSHRVPISALGFANHCSRKTLQDMAKLGPEQWFASVDL